MTGLLAGLLLLGGGLPAAHAVIRYVAPGGQGSCSQATNPATPRATIKDCVTCMTGGDICEIASGTYNGIFTMPSGTAAAPTTIRAAPGATVTMMSSQGGDQLMWGESKNHWRVERIIFECGTVLAYCLYGDINSNNWTFTGTTMRNAPSQGYLGKVGNLIFEDCVMTNNGISPTGGNKNQTFYWSGTGGAIRRCIIEDSDGWGIQLYPAGSNVIVERNIWRNNSGGVTISGTGNIIRNNIFYGNGAGLFVYNGNNKVYNNTFWGNSDWGIHTQQVTTAGVVTNNLAYNNGVNIFCYQPQVCVTNYTSNPSFVNPPSNFHLQSGSGAIGYGTNLGSAVPNDYDGNTRPQGGTWDAGAYEFLSGPANTPPVVAITAPTNQPTYATFLTPLTTLAGTATDSGGTVSSVAWSCPTCTPTSGTAVCTGCGTATASWTVASVGLTTSQPKTITVTATDNAGATASDTLAVTYTALAPTSLVFGQPPTSSSINVTLTPAVTCVVLDQLGQPFTPSPPATVTVALGANPGGATLNGTLPRPTVGATATFDDLQLTASGINYTLTCNAAAMTGATSGPFDIVPNPAALTGSPSAQFLGRH